MKIAFWSEEDGCGTTSGMAAIASVCADIWHRRSILFQSSNQEGDLFRKLGAGMRGGRTGPVYRDIWAELCWLADSGMLTKASLFSYLVPAARGRMYYLPQGEYKKQDSYAKETRSGISRIIRFAEQTADLIFIDCGSGKDGLSEYLLSQADVAVVTISQERQNLDAYFQSRHAFQGKVLYLVSPYHQESIYNRKNINRLYRLREEEMAVIPHNPVFRYMSEKGKIERFVRRQLRGTAIDNQRYFMQELVHTAEMLLKTAGISACGKRSPAAGTNDHACKSPAAGAEIYAGGYMWVRPPPGQHTGLSMAVRLRDRLRKLDTELFNPVFIYRSHSKDNVIFGSDLFSFCRQMVAPSDKITADRVVIVGC